MLTDMTNREKFSDWLEIAQYDLDTAYLVLMQREQPINTAMWSLDLTPK